jgi:N-dimethylarginine dimethylaminohydrolase
MSPRVYTSLASLDFGIDDLPAMPLPNTALMVHPKAFDVIYSINPHMQEHIGKVDRNLAVQQWEAIKNQYEKLGLDVPVIDGAAGLPDMVFCANQSLPDLAQNGQKRVLMSNMRHQERKAEVPHIRNWYESQGFDIHELSSTENHFEGMGDAIWHLGKRLIWGGYGYRTEAKVYDDISQKLDVPVILLELQHPSLYHLDTCLTVLTEKTVLIYPGAFTDDGLELIHHFFENVLEAKEEETMHYLACNAVCPDGKHVIIDENCINTIELLTKAGFTVVGTDTSEYLKSGGSVFCMKLLLWNS